MRHSAFFHHCPTPTRLRRRKPWRCPYCRKLWTPAERLRTVWESVSEGETVIESVTIRYPDGSTRSFSVETPV